MTDAEFDERVKSFIFEEGREFRNTKNNCVLRVDRIDEAGVIFFTVFHPKEVRTGDADKRTLSIIMAAVGY